MFVLLCFCLQSPTGFFGEYALGASKICLLVDFINHWSEDKNHIVDFSNRVQQGIHIQTVPYIFSVLLYSLEQMVGADRSSLIFLDVG